MYLDPGTTGLIIQGFFGLIVAILATLSKPKQTLMSLWRRISGRNGGK